MACSVKSLLNACKMGPFPTAKAMSDFGILNINGLNPIHVFECYRLAITKDNLRYHNISEALKNDKLNHVIMNSPSVKSSPYYDIITKKGGIVNGYLQQMNECDTCLSVERILTCSHT